ncbi:HAD-IIIA family hydrolase [Candidatus Woesearchaeota archaeon]|nr:HAD-IIIA family hydrolase [Candidatus Woesearchaeota archaeon]
MQKAIFLDKDGTLVDNSGYPLAIPTDQLLANLAPGLLYLQKKDFKLIIISNQSWIAKGKLTEQQVHGFFSHIIQQLHHQGITITDYYFCPHQRLDNCECRKPKITLLQKAAGKHQLDLSASYFIGDMEDDILCGKNAGTKTILVQTGEGKKYCSSIQPDFIIPHLNEIQTVI